VCSLAILGEASVLAHAQVGFLSRWSYVPRLIPAPQALIRTERPERLKPSGDKIVVGSHSGNVRPSLNHVAHVLHEEGDSLDSYSVRVVSLEEDRTKPPVKAKWYSPVTALALLGSLMAAGLLIFSVVKKDGYSTLGTLLLSTLSSLIGVGSKWTLKLPVRHNKEVEVPSSDVVISYPHGAFLVVKCDENVARSLYWAPERCRYMVTTEWYRFISLVGTLMLMGGVIMLANSTNELQLAWAVAYMILNAAYWVVAALPSRWNWELSGFKLRDVKTRYLQDTQANLQITSDGQDGAEKIRRVSRSGTDLRKPGAKLPELSDKDNVGSQNTTFTQALWHAIAVTKTSHWVKITNVAPNTDEWKEWLEVAESEAQSTSFVEEGLNNDDGEELATSVARVPKWDAQRALNDILNKDNNRRSLKIIPETV
jgi:hypothetical protein